MKRLFIYLTLLAGFFSCDKSELKTESSESMVIKTGTICGWCAGSDSLILTETRTIYGKFDPCDDGDIHKDQVTDKDKYSKLLQEIDFEKFKTIDINTCHSCVDGCDTWISISNNGEEHFIRFGYNDSLVIQPIQEMVNQLDDWRLSCQN